MEYPEFSVRAPESEVVDSDCWCRDDTCLEMGERPSILTIEQVSSVVGMWVPSIQLPTEGKRKQVYYLLAGNQNKGGNSSYLLILEVKSLKHTDVGVLWGLEDNILNKEEKNVRV